jgi:excisionase family DNA binding protein
MPSRNRGPNSAQLWGLDDATAMRPQAKPPHPLRVPPPIPDPLPPRPADDRDGGGLVLLLSVEDAGKALGVSRSTVYELIGSGDLEVVHVRRSVRLPVDAVHDFVRRLRAGRVRNCPHQISSGSGGES